MFDKLEMKQVAMTVKNIPACALADALRLARENLDGQKAWLLAESPRQVIWGEFADKIADPGLEECLFLLAFDEASEIRFYRQNRNAPCLGRHVAENPRDTPTLERRSSYLIKNRGGRLELAEHFIQNENGLYKFAFSRYCGVRRLG